MEPVIGFISSILSAMTHDKLKEYFQKKVSAYKERKGPSVDGFNLNQKRKVEIECWRQQYEPLLRKKRKEHLQEMHEIQKTQIQQGKNIFVKPAWYTLSTTPSDKKYRLVMGFRNNGCCYWRNDDDQVGCLHCSYGSKAIQLRKVTARELMAQFGVVKEWAVDHGLNYDVIEFLNDGSFFNFEDEFPDNFPSLLFSEISEIPYVKRVLVETRPQYLTDDKIRLLLSRLASHQKLEIGLGFETVYDFIRETCIRKGYGIPEFENAVLLISKFKNRCGIVVYIVIKPAFLTEKEAIEDVVNTIKYLLGVSKKYKIKVVPKLEPAAVSQGSILDILHFDVPCSRKEWYEPLSYWSLVEIISRAYLLKLHSNLRIGAREDMDIIEKVPSICRKDGTFNQYDFWVYDAVQRFNSDHNIVRFFSDIQVVLEEDKDESFETWKNRVGIDNSATTICLKSLTKKINKFRRKGQQKEREEFLSKVFHILNDIELENDSHERARQLKDEESTIVKDNIEFFIRSKFTKLLGGNYGVHVITYFFEKDKRHMLRVHFQLLNIAAKCSHDIWVGIPTKN